MFRQKKPIMFLCRSVLTLCTGAAVYIIIAHATEITIAVCYVIMGIDTGYLAKAKAIVGCKSSTVIKATTAYLTQSMSLPGTTDTSFPYLPLRKFALMSQHNQIQER